MRRSSRRLLFVLLAASAAAGCGTSVFSSQAEPRGDEIAEMQARILELQQKAAMAEVELRELRQEVALLEGRLGDGARAATPAPSEVVPVPTPVRPDPVGADARGPEREVEVSDLPAEPPPVAARPVETKGVAAAGSGDREALPIGEPAQALYDRGYTLYHQGRYVDAESAFVQFIGQHGTSALADNAQYWIGESRYARSDYRGALAAFRETAESYPDGNKVPAALLKAGICLEALGDPAAARQVYREVQSRFPRAAAAITAEQRERSLP
jgi:tol-pal system protein YbgF